MTHPCMHCRKPVRLDVERDVWVADDGTLTDTFAERLAAGTARLDVFDVPVPEWDGQSYREATFARNDPLLSGHLMPFVHLPVIDFWYEGWGPDPRMFATMEAR